MGVRMSLWRRLVLWYQRACLVSNLKWVVDEINELTAQGSWHPSYTEDLMDLQRARGAILEAINDINRKLST